MLFDHLCAIVVNYGQTKGEAPFYKKTPEMLTRLVHYVKIVDNCPCSNVFHP